MIEQIKNLIHKIYDISGIIQWGGLFIICAIIFAETGLLAGFFLPGDSLLVTAGIFAAAGHLNIIYLLIFVTLSAIIGDQVGYYIGHKAGKFLFTKKESSLFKTEYLEKAKKFYEKYGPKTIVLARFVPIIRTFAPAIAGATNMEYKKFIFYNIFGGILWSFTTILGGYFLGSLIPDIEKKLHIVIGIVIIVSFIPIIIEYLKYRKENKPQPITNN